MKMKFLLYEKKGEAYIGKILYNFTKCKFNELYGVTIQLSYHAFQHL